MAVPAARILEQRSHLVPGRLNITEHLFEVPRDYASPQADSIRLFARSAQKHAVPATPSAPSPSPPWLLYLQGGPGMECRSPQSYPFTQSFVDKGYQVLFLDQRGTGLSSAISARTLARQGGVKEQVQYLKSFRADSIIKDCEAIRLALTEQQRAEDAEKRADGKNEDWRKWSIIGQSFGGFCCVTYLSHFPQGLREVFIAGGVPPVRPTQGADEVYARTTPRVIKRNQMYYDKFPEDVERVKTIVRFLQRAPYSLPSGGVLTPRRFLQMGLGMGFHGGIESLHEKVLQAHNDLQLFDLFSRSTAHMLDTAMSFDTNVIYAILHEAIYCQGTASRWSADRIIRQTPAFDIEAALGDSSKAVHFTGEMVFPWMLDDYSELRPLKEVAETLAHDPHWPELYDVKQLAENAVPVYAAVYKEDMYVDYELSQQTAGGIRGCQTMETNRVYHNGIVSKEELVIQGLLAMRDDVLD